MFCRFALGNIKKVFQITRGLCLGVIQSNMVRYFPNHLKDFENVTVDLDLEVFRQDIERQIQSITKRIPPQAKYIDGGLYVGITGIAYMFYRLSQNTRISENKRKYLEKGIEYVKPALETTSGDRTSFLLGDAGAFAVATVLFKALGDNTYQKTLDNYKSLYSIYLKPKFLKCGADEFFVGRSGYLAGALWISQELKTPIFSDEELYEICNVIVDSGRQYSQMHKSPCPLMYQYYGTEYLGAAHGISFIMQMLLSVPGYLEYNAGAASDIKESVKYLASLQNSKGNWPCSMEEIDDKEHKLIHWCHGAPGMVYLMARAYLVYREKEYYDACIKAGDIVWERGLLRKGPGICHGVAGNGYVFLMLFRLTGDPKYLHRAKMFAEFMKSDEFLNEARVPDNPQSLYEGNAGAVCYFSDLLLPEKAVFPFQDVFV